MRSVDALAWIAGRGDRPPPEVRLWWRGRDYPQVRGVKATLRLPSVGLDTDPTLRSVSRSVRVVFTTVIGGRDVGCVNAVDVER